MKGRENDTHTYPQDHPETHDLPTTLQTGTTAREEVIRRHQLKCLYSLQACSVIKHAMCIERRSCHIRVKASFGIERFQCEVSSGTASKEREDESKRVHLLKRLRLHVLTPLLLALRRKLIMAPAMFIHIRNQLLEYLLPLQRSRQPAHVLEVRFRERRGAFVCGEVLFEEGEEVDVAGVGLGVDGEGGTHEGETSGGGDDLGGEGSLDGGVSGGSAGWDNSVGRLMLEEMSGSVVPFIGEVSEDER